MRALREPFAHPSPPRPRGRASRVGCVVLCWATNAQAQAQEPRPAQLDKVEVTGSRISRIEGESGLPVQVITRDEMHRGGMQTMQDLLERISANQSFGSANPTLGVGNMVSGFTSASLRGLGSQRTLVLLDGRRLAPYALSGGQSVDLSGIPAAAIERVEILKDGASAVYGSDAIGGVINFILRQDYQGVEANANVYATTQGGGDNGRISLTAGSGDLAEDKFNAFVAVDYFKQQALAASQREFTRTSYLPGIGMDGTSTASVPANIAQTDFGTGDVYGFSGAFNPTLPPEGGAHAGSCRPPYSFPTSRTPSLCRFDYLSVIDTVPAYEQVQLLGRLSWQYDAGTLLFAEATYYRGEFDQLISPTPIFPSDANALPPGSPYYPRVFVAGLPGGRADLPLMLAYRTLELGPRVNRTDVDQWTGAAGARGTLHGWDYQFAANFTANAQADHYRSGYVYTSKFDPLLRSGVVNPFGANAPGVIEQMRATQVTGQANDNRASNYGAMLTLANSVARLPAGPLAIAAGIEGRRESLRQTNADFIVEGDVAGGGGAVPSLAGANRNVVSLFGEADVAIVTGLEANLAVRYDHYSDFGGTANPKLTLRWQPAKTLLLRAAYGSGFRAPTLSDLHQPQSLAPSDLVDPVRCPVTGDFYDCGGGIATLAGGNPRLQPETSRQLDAGIVFAPLAGLSVGLDYYRVSIDNVILIVPGETILGPDHAAFGSGYVVREPPDEEHPDLPGRIVHVVQYPTNVGSLRTSGVDLDLQWRGPETALGRFAFTLNATYVIDYSQSGFLPANVPPAAGMRGVLGAIASYRQYAQLDWSHGPWGATLANNFQNGYSEPCLEADPTGCTTRRVGSHSVWDLQARYTGWKQTTLTLGVRNLLDSTPPVSNQESAFQRGIDPTYSDPRGRMVYLALRHVFE